MSDDCMNHDWQPICVCGNDLTVSEVENGWECAACRWEASQEIQADTEIDARRGH